MHVFVNELSFQAQAIDMVNASRLMTDLITVIRGLKRIQGDDPICTSSILWEQEISPGLSVQQWLMQTNRDEMVLLKKLLRNGPYSEILIDSVLSYHECWLNGQDVCSSSLAAAVFFRWYRE